MAYAQMKKTMSGRERFITVPKTQKKHHANHITRRIFITIFVCGKMVCMGEIKKDIEEYIKYLKIYYEFFKYQIKWIFFLVRYFHVKPKKIIKIFLRNSYTVRLKILLLYLQVLVIYLLLLFFLFSIEKIDIDMLLLLVRLIARGVFITIILSTLLYCFYWLFSLSKLSKKAIYVSFFDIFSYVLLVQIYFSFPFIAFYLLYLAEWYYMLYFVYLFTSMSSIFIFFIAPFIFYTDYTQGVISLVFNIILINILSVLFYLSDFHKTKIHNFFDRAGYSLNLIDEEFEDKIFPFYKNLEKMVLTNSNEAVEASNKWLLETTCNYKYNDFTIVHVHLNNKKNYTEYVQYLNNYNKPYLYSRDSIIFNRNKKIYDSISKFFHRHLETIKTLDAQKLCKDVFEQVRFGMYLKSIEIISKTEFPYHYDYFYNYYKDKIHIHPPEIYRFSPHLFINLTSLTNIQNDIKSRYKEIENKEKWFGFIYFWTIFFYPAEMTIQYFEK
jgi:hypothetical protein